MTEAQRAEIHARAEAASFGIWDTEYSGYCGPLSIVDGSGETIMDNSCRNCGGTPGTFEREEDLAFVLHAREDVLTLLAALYEAEHDRDTARAQTKELMDDYQDLGKAWTEDGHEIDRLTAELARVRAKAQDLANRFVVKQAPRPMLPARPDLMWTIEQKTT